MKYNYKKIKRDAEEFDFVDTTGSYDNVGFVEVVESNEEEPLAYIHVNRGYQEIVYWNGLNQNTEVRHLILRHEYGHAYYNHLPATPQLLAQVRSYRNDLTREQERYILNVCMDFQVNSTLLSLPDVEMIEKWVGQKKGQAIQNCYPTRHDYPEGRTTEEYIDRMMLDMQDQDPTDFLGPGAGQFPGEGDDGDESEDSTGKFGTTSITVSEEKYKELREQQEKYGTASRGDDRGNQANVYGEIEVAPNLTAIQKLTNLIRPYMKRIHRSYRLDMKICRNVYKNTLRGRTKMYVPSYKTQVTRVYEKGAIDFLVDVSGSTNPDVNKKIVRDAFELIATPGKFMDIYMWDTDLVQKVTAKDLQELGIYKFKCGGGTELANGINYISQQSDDKRPLVIISDLEDSLDDWRKELKKCGYNFSDVLILNHGGEVKMNDFPEIIQLPEEYFMN